MQFFNALASNAKNMKKLLTLNNARAVFTNASTAVANASRFCDLTDIKCSSDPEVESRTQGSRPRPKPRTQKKSEAKAKAKDSFSEDRRSRGQGQECSRPRPRTKDTKRKCSPKKKKKKKGLHKNFSGDLQKKKIKRSSQKFFKRSPLKNVFQTIFQALHKILTFQKIVLSLNRGQANFRGLEASRPRPRTSNCVLEDVLEAKDVLEDSTFAQTTQTLSSLSGRF